MASIRTVFEAVVDNGTTGKKVKIGVATYNEYETIRTRLVTLWTEQREIILAIGGEDSDPLLVYSLCSDFYEDAHATHATDDTTSSYTAVFYLGKPRRKLAKSYSFEIVGSSDEQLPSTTAANSLTTAEPANESPITLPPISTAS